jgi:hypothetical protein
MAKFLARKMSSLGVILFAALIGNCSTDLRRDDLEGKPCPCLPLYEELWRGSSCTCVLRGANESGGASGNSGLGAAGMTAGGTTQADGGQVGSGGTIASGGSGGKFTSGGNNLGGDWTTLGGTTSPGGTNDTGGTSPAGGTSAIGGASNGTPPTCLPPLDPPTVYSCNLPCQSCNGGICAANCGAVGCGVEFVCASGMPCEVTCSENKSCKNLRVSCPAGYPCNVICTGKNSCNGLTVNCHGDGPCTLNCTEPMSDCGNATVNCDTGRCKATCGTSLNPNVQYCERSCQQVGCGC